jgi:methionyl aminopeptidase
VITVKSTRELDLMARAGRVVGATLALVAARTVPGVTTAALDAIAEEFIRSHEGATPSFKGLYGFPATLCTSVNHEVVHGIPSKDRVLREGDILSVDVGACVGGFHADSALTVPVGGIRPEVASLLRTTDAALAAGVAAVRAGGHVGDIGHAVQSVAEAAGFSVVRELVGHGIGSSFHEEPQVPNFGAPHKGPRLVAGMTIAIEPMINAGRRDVRTMPDRWTVVTADGSLSAHFEHTVVVTDDGARVLTGRPATTP